MRARNAGSIVAAAGWLLFLALAISFLRSPETGCAPSAFWTSGWFFAPPVVAVGAIAVARARGVAAALGLLLLGCWALAFLNWLLFAIGAGATCGGG